MRKMILLVAVLLAATTVTPALLLGVAVPTAVVLASRIRLRTCIG